MKGKYKIRRCAAVFLAVCFIFVPAACGVFYSQRMKLEAEFDHMVEDNLTSYTRAQKSCLTGSVEDVKNTLAGIAGLADHMGLTDTEGELKSYLENFNRLNGVYSIDYLSMAELERASDHGNGGNDTRNWMESLKSGQSAVSEIKDSGNREGSCVFAVAQPVTEEERVAGALCSRLDPMEIFKSVPEASTFKKSSTLIVKKDGTILASNNQEHKEAAQEDLFASMEAAGIPSDSVEELRGYFLEMETGRTQFQGKGNDYYFSWDSLGYNGWYIVNFVRSPDVAIHYENILEGTIMASLFLIFLAAALGGGIVMLILRQRKKLDLEEKKYSILEEFADTALFTYDSRTDTLDFTGNAGKILMMDNLKMEHVTGNGCRDRLFLPEDRGIMENMLKSRRGKGEDEIQYAEVRLMSASGDYHWFGCHYKAVDASRTAVKVIGKVADISLQRIREHALREQAVRDTLTGAYNKAGEQIIAGLLEAQTQGLFLMLDLDDFKSVNDTKGHATGDTVLIEVGKVLKRVCREHDIVARIGGDEFALFLPGAFDRAAADRKVEEIQKHLRSVRFDMWGINGVKASIGAVLCPEEGRDYDTLYRAADLAMYSVKRQSKRQPEIYA